MVDKEKDVNIMSWQDEMSGLSNLQTIEITSSLAGGFSEQSILSRSESLEP